MFKALERLGGKRGEYLSVGKWGEGGRDSGKGGSLIDVDMVIGGGEKTIESSRGYGF